MKVDPKIDWSQESNLGQLKPAYELEGWSARSNRAI